MKTALLLVSVLTLFCSATLAEARFDIRLQANADEPGRNLHRHRDTSRDGFLLCCDDLFAFLLRHRDSARTKHLGWRFGWGAFGNAG